MTARDRADAPALVSVVIPCYNASGFVGDAVASVVEQGVEGVEILVVDDGSADGDALREVLRPFGDAVTRLDGPHLGLARTRNRGIEAARGRFLAFLDADDVWGSGFLARQLSLLERSGADLVYCDAAYFGDPEVEGRTVMQDLPSHGPVTLGSILSARCMVVMSTVVARTERIRAVGGFDPERDYCEDLDLWVRLLEDGCAFAYHTDADVRRRVHPGSMSRHGAAMLDGAITVVGRHVDSPRLSEDERRRVLARLQRMAGERRLYTAKEAIRHGDAGAARRALWGSFVRRPGWKPAAAAMLLTVAPGPALRYLSSRPD